MDDLSFTKHFYSAVTEIANEVSFAEFGIGSSDINDILKPLAKAEKKLEQLKEYVELNYNKIE